MSEKPEKFRDIFQQGDGFSPFQAQNLSTSETPNAPDEKSAEERSLHPSAALNHSAGQLPDLVLNQPSRRRGQLIHPADAGQIPAVNGIGRRNGGVFPHEHCCHSDTLLP